jgi:hypothetical protein
VFAAEPALPALKPSELADIVEQHQNQFAKIKAQYKITYGTAPDSRSLQTQFSPDNPKYEVTAEYGSDSIAHKIYIDENMLTKDQKSFVVKAAFDGEVGTVLSMLVPGENQWAGKILSGTPEAFNPLQASHWRPPDSTFWPLKGRDLAGLIRGSKDVSVIATTTNGAPAYLATIHVTTETIVHVDSRPTIGQIHEVYRIWLSPAYGMLPIRQERLMSDQAKDPNGIAALVRINSDFRESAPGVWFPHQVFEYRHRQDRPVAVRIDVQQVKFGNAADVPGRVVFPDGAYVTDTIKGIKYTVGISRESLNARVGKLALEIKSLQSEAKDVDPTLKAPLSTGLTAPASTGRLIAVACILGGLFLLAGYFMLRKRKAH